MTSPPLPLILLALLLFLPSCYHRTAREAKPQPPHYSHEEAAPVSELPHEEFSQITPRAHSQRAR